MKNIKLLHFLQTVRNRRGNMCYKTPLTNQELKSIGYRESMFNDYLYKFYGDYSNLIDPNEVQYGVPAEALIELKSNKNKKEKGKENKNGKSTKNDYKMQRVYSPNAEIKVFRN